MADTNVGTVSYDARINTSQLKKDAAETERITKKTSEAIGDDFDKSDNRIAKTLGSVMGKVGAAAATATAAIGAAAVATAAFGVKSAADFQQTRIGLENMLGSAQNARELLGDISKFAAETPFEFPELAQATRQLVAFGFTGKEAFETMKQLGDVSAAVGAPINDLAYLMGTLKTQGRAFTVDIRQFAQRGIPIYEYLAKVLGTNEQAINEMIEAGKIGFPEVQKAFEAMTKEGGKFNGTMEKQSKSLTGVFSTLKDNIGQTVRELVGIDQFGDIKPGSLFDLITKGASGAIVQFPILIEDIKEAVKTLADGFKGADTDMGGFLGVLEEVGAVARGVFEYLAPKFTELFETIKEQIPTYLNYWKEVWLPIVAVLGGALVGAIGFAVDGVTLLLKVFEPLMQFLTDHEWIVWAVVGAFTALKVALAIQSAVVAFQGAMTAVQVSFVATKAIITTPIVMPALVIGAALASIYTVKRAIDEVFDSIEAIKQQEKSIRNNAASNEEVIRRMRAIINDNVSSPQTKANAMRTLQGMQFAKGTNFAPGGVSLVGEKGPELVDLPRGSKVIPNNELSDYMGGGGSNITVTVNMDGILARSRSDLRDIGTDIIKAVDEGLKAKGIAPIMGTI